MSAQRLFRRCLLPVVLCLTAGCSALRCPKVSEQSIADARRLSLQGLEAVQRGHWENAEALFAAAVIKCPHDERARCGYAESLWRRGAVPDAISHMEESVRLSGHDPERLVQLGNMYFGVGDFERSAEQARRAIAANQELASAWALRGDVLRAQGNRDEALASYHRALVYQEQFPGVQLAIADIYREENRPERSLATLHSLAANFPAGQAPPDLVARQASAMQALGRHHDADRLLAHLNRGPNSPAPPANLARSP